MNLFHIVLTIVWSLLATMVHAGSIPMRPTNLVAADLVDSGQNITPTTARYLRDQKGVDLSKLNPDTSSEIWNGFTSRLKPQLDELQLPVTDAKFIFDELRPTRLGSIRLNVSRTGKDGRVERYVLMLGLKAHNILLRKALLRRLGYYVPEVQHLRSLELQFKGPASRDYFVKDLSNIFADALSSPNDWVTNIQQKTSKRDDGTEKVRWEIVDSDASIERESYSLHLQDVIVFKDEDHMYNLSRGYVSSRMIGEGRRVFNALLLPLTLVDVPESVNLFSWCTGVVGNGNLVLPYSEVSRSTGVDNFSTSYEDAKWILREILKLTRDDFQEVVRHGQFPKPVAMLLTEKIISRRNCLRDHFKFDSDGAQKGKVSSIYRRSSELPVSTKISFGESLQNGQLFQQKWEGHASQYAFANPESPLSSTEMWSYAKSLGQSNIISNLISQFNSEFFPSPTNQIMEKVRERQIEVVLDKFKEFLRTGRTSKVPFGLWTTPIYTGNALLSRELIIGSYLGTDNKVQLVDNIGFSAMAGQFIGAEGLQAKVSASGKAVASISRIYSHVKPIYSMKRALNEPFKNMIVPLLQKEYALLFDELLSGDFSSLKKEEAKKRITQVFEVFNEKFEVGESIIITNSIGGSIEATAGYSLGEKIGAHLTFMGSQNVISRLHIFRSNEETLHIYDDRGQMLSLGASMGINAYSMPILNLYLKRNSGSASTRFFKLNIDQNSNRNPDLIGNLKAFRSVMLEKSFRVISGMQKPYLVDHNFHDWDRGGALLFYRGRKVSGENLIEVTHPSGFKKEFVQSRSGFRDGLNYIGFTTDLINAAISEKTNEDYSVGASDSGNPGDTLFGKSALRQIVVDAIVNSPDTGGVLKESFSHVNYRWKGWKADKRKIFQIVDEIHEKVGSPIVEKRTLLDMVEMQLYSLDLNVFVYDSGISHLLARKELLPILLEEHLREDSKTARELQEADGNLMLELHALDGLKRKLIRLAESVKDSKDSKRAANSLRQLIDLLESELTFEGFLLALGGSDNFYVNAVLRGFRQNDPNGDSPYISNSLGFLGYKKTSGPINYVLQNMEMTESEFYAYWLRARL